jgi:carbamoylphosphate synthase large subunit
MPALVLIVRNLCLQSGISGEVMENLEEVTNILEETLRELPS